MTPEAQRIAQEKQIQALQAEVNLLNAVANRANERAEIAEQQKKEMAEILDSVPHLKRVATADWWNQDCNTNCPACRWQKMKEK